MADRMGFSASQSHVHDITTESTLCERCSVLRFDDRAKGFEIKDGSVKFVGNYQELDYIFSDQFPHLTGLRASAEAGCAFCGALRHAVSTSYLNISGRVTFRLSYYWVWDRLISLLVDVKVEGEGKKTRDQLKFTVGQPRQSVGSDRWNILRVDPSSSHETLCPQNVAWMKKHLTFCDDHHLTGLTSAFRPTRLLDLCAKGCDENFRLIDTSDNHPGHDKRYAALSYCWGPREDARKQLKTMSYNVRQHHDCILFNDVTPVVQDAVTMARALSIRYLWIDALCIIQDESRDWARESDQMGKIYANAYLTLCTLASASCMEGFLDRPSMVNVKFQSQRVPGSTAIITLRHEQRKYGRYDERNDVNSQAPWRKRAWTMQEEHLSKRRMYFDQFCTYLDCPQGHLSETSDHLHLIRNRHAESFAEKILRSKESRNDEILYNQWSNIFATYVRRLLTRRTDTLPALSGLAKTMAANLDDTYLAGLWQHDLHRGLLWRTILASEDLESFRRHLASHHQVGQYIAPTWSWASRGIECCCEPTLFTTAAEPRLNHKAEYLPYHATLETSWRSECHTSAAWCTPVSAAHHYGQIKHGEVHINGKIKEIPQFWTRNSRWLSEFRVSCDGSGVSCAFDFAASAEPGDVDTLRVFLFLLGTSCHKDNWHWPADHHFERLKEHVTEVVKEKLDRAEGEVPKAYQGKRYAPEFRNAWGLALTTVAGTEKFVRIGIFRISWEFGGPRYFDDEPVSTVKII